jgi:predicted peptidase
MKERMHVFECLESRLHLSHAAATGLLHSTESLASAQSLLMKRSPSVTSRTLSFATPAVTITPATDLSDSVTGTVSDGKLSVPFRFFLPQLATPAQKVPLIVYLHGLGDGGTDNVSQTFWMSNLRANTTSGQYPACILAMQLPVGMQWYSTGKQPSEPEALLMSLIKNILPIQPNIDPARIYLTGVSAGALGVWDLLHRNPKFFAAGVPMSGALGTSIAPSLKSIPIWAFHGAADTGVSPIYTRQLIAAIVKAGGTPWYTEVPGGGHFIWDAMYAEASLYAWMFSKHLA